MPARGEGYRIDFWFFFFENSGSCGGCSVAGTREQGKVVEKKGDERKEILCLV